MKLIEYTVHFDLHSGATLQTIRQEGRAESPEELVKSLAAMLSELRASDGVLEVGPCVGGPVGFQLVPAREVESMSVEMHSVADLGRPDERLNAQGSKEAEMRAWLK